MQFVPVRISNMSSARLPGLLAFLLLMAPALPVAAQGSDETVRVSLRVEAVLLEAGIEVVTLRDMQFDRVAPSDIEVSINPLFDAGAAVMRAVGRPNTPIRLTFAREQRLIHADGGPALTFYYEISGSPSDDQFTAQLLDLADAPHEFSSTGEFFFWVGGRVNITEAVPGQYIGDFVMEVEYM
jgi:hypothetical protein